MPSNGRWHVVAVFLVVLVGRQPARRRRRRCPSEPLTFGDGRVTLGGDVSATASCAERRRGRPSHCTTTPASSTTPTTSTRRCGCCASASRPRSRPAIASRCSASSQRERRAARSPTRCTCASGRGASRGFDIQAGRVPPTFGAFARRTYPADNLLIGYPLAYQYLTSLRPDALPANADELLRMRGRGWLSSFSVGNPAPDRGLPLVSAFRWDTGVQVHAANQTRRRGRRGDDRHAATRSSATTTPASRSPDGSRCGRSPGLIVGVSAARGPFVTRDALRSAGVERRRRSIHADRPGAPTPSTRATTTSSGSRRSSATGGCRSCAPGSTCRCARSRRSSKDATRSVRVSTRRRASITSASARSPAPRATTGGMRRSRASRSAAATRCSATLC